MRDECRTCQRLGRRRWRYQLRHWRTRGHLCRLSGARRHVLVQVDHPVACGVLRLRMQWLLLRALLPVVERMLLLLAFQRFHALPTPFGAESLLRLSLELRAAFFVGGLIAVLGSRRRDCCCVLHVLPPGCGRLRRCHESYQ